MSAHPAQSVAAQPTLVVTRAQLAEQLDALRSGGRTLGFVPTMGALHAGHLSLVEASQRQCDATVVSIFVNPLQFGPHDDFRRYPRTLQADLGLLAGKADLVFHPDASEIYPSSHATTVEPAGVALPLEGQCRPGHFRGVATVVLKLFNLVRPDRAYFGQKDYQQSLVVRQMVADLDLPIGVRVCPIVREPDGLALSSRNVYLSPAQRRRALALSGSLRAAAELVAQGERNAAVVVQRMRGILAAADAHIDYAALADPTTLAQPATIAGPVVALVAARIGATRLIDNAVIDGL